MAFALSVIFLIEVLFLDRFEKVKNKFFTPICALGLPFGIIMLFVSIIDFTSFTEYKMSYVVPLCSLVYLTVFFIVGRVFSIRIPYIRRILKRKYGRVNDGILYEYNCKNCIYGPAFPIFVTVSFLLIIIYAIKQLGLSGVKDMNLIKTLFSDGIMAHLLIIICVIMLLMFAQAFTLKNSNLRFIYFALPVLWIGVVLLTEAKYFLITYAVTLIFIFLFFSKTKHVTLKVVFLFLLAALLFGIVYVARFLFQGETLRTIDYSFILNHYYYYFVSGFYAFSASMERGLNGIAGIGIVLAPLLNIIKIFGIGKGAESISEFIDVKVGLNYDKTNVFTLFGVYNHEIGMIYGLFFIALLALFVYYNYSKIFTECSIARVVLVSYMFSTLVCAFFNSFYGTMNVWEIIILLLIFIYYEIIKKDKNSLLKTVIKRGKNNFE